MWKRILFPLLTLAIPGGLLGWMFYNSNMEQVREFEKYQKKAAELGYFTTVTQYQAQLPAPSDNAAVPLAEGYGKVKKWDDLGNLAVMPARYLPATDHLVPYFRDAASRSRLAFSFAKPDDVWSDLAKVEKMHWALLARARALVQAGRVSEAESHFEWASAIRDRLIGGDLSPVAVVGANMGIAIDAECLWAAGRLGPKGAAIARRFHTTAEPKFQSTVSGRANAAFQTALLDSWLDSKQWVGSVPRKPTERDRLLAHTAIVRWWAENNNSLMKSGVTAETLAMNFLPQMGGRELAAGEQLVHAAFRISPVIGRARIVGNVPRDLIDWYLRACDAGGKAPAGIDAAKDKIGAGLRFKVIPNGFIVYSMGLDMRDNGAAPGSDDRFIRYQLGRVTSRE